MAALVATALYMTAAEEELAGPSAEPAAPQVAADLFLVALVAQAAVLVVTEAVADPEYSGVTQVTAPAEVSVSEGFLLLEFISSLAATQPSGAATAAAVAAAVAPAAHCFSVAAAAAVVALVVSVDPAVAAASVVAAHLASFCQARPQRKLVTTRFPLPTVALAA